MLRIEVAEEGRSGSHGSADNPGRAGTIDVDDVSFVIGSDPTARVRLPASAARPDHIRIDRGTFRTAESSGPIGEGQSFTVGRYSVRVAPAPPGAVAAPPQRTVSLARELMRNLLGSDGEPTLEIESGPSVGAKRPLEPPDSVLVLGRGSEASWVILDPDLSKCHAEIRRGWDGVRVVDLGSKNGTKVDGARVREASLRDGSTIEIGNVVVRFRDPAERHLAADLPPAPIVVASTRRYSTAFYVAIAVMALAFAGLVWIALSSL